MTYPGYHAALGVVGNFEGTHFNVNDQKYFYAEATGTHWLNQKATWKIGQIPLNYQSKEAQVYVIK